MRTPALASEAILEVAGLSKRFGEVTAVDGISFSLMPGETLGLLGGNGAGKTTTIAMILGLLTPTSGRVTAFGMDALKSRRAVAARMNFQSPYVELPFRLTVRENLTVYGKLYGVAGLPARIAALAADLDLTALLKRPFGDLSAGQKTRVSLAKSLINRPRLLLLDEPTASLDPDTADWVRTYLERYRTETGAAILLASHNMAEVERLCGRVLMMKKGLVIDDGTPAELMTRFGRTNLEDVFLDLARGRGAAAGLEDVA